jgi:hypothetical protein
MIKGVWGDLLWRLRVRVRVACNKLGLGLQLGLGGRVTKGRLTRSQSSLGQTIFIPKPYLFLLDKI